MANFDFLKGNIEIIILNALSLQDGYGYDIAKEIKDKTQNSYEIKQPTLYAYLKRLELQELITSYWGSESSGGRRRYYKITEKGRQFCQNFNLEWKYQKTVLDTLVPDDDSLPITQKDTTLMFGKKVKKPVQKITQIEQEEIAKQLDLLKDVTASTQSKPLAKADVTASTQSKPLAKNNDLLIEEEVTAPAPTTFLSYKKSSLEHKPIATTSQIEDVSNPDIDLQPYAPNKEEFLEKFNKKAQEIIDKNIQTAQPDVKEVLTETSYDDVSTNSTAQQTNYKHVFNTLLKTQLDDSALHSADVDIQPEIKSSQTSSLDELADSLAKVGIKLKVYNNQISNYAPQAMLYKNKIIFVSIWLTYFATAIEMLFVWLAGINVLPINTLIIYWLCLATLPIALTILYIINPNKKTKPIFNFKYHIVNALIGAGLIIILVFSLFVLFGCLFSDTVQLLTYVILPLIVAINVPMYPVFYKLIFKKMLI
ncbi:MAG: PadR family transcriptional regulator [Clostridia bacterium]